MKAAEFCFVLACCISGSTLYCCLARYDRWTLRLTCHIEISASPGFVQLSFSFLLLLPSFLFFNKQGRFRNKIIISTYLLFSPKFNQFQENIIWVKLKWLPITWAGINKNILWIWVFHSELPHRHILSDPKPHSQASLLFCGSNTIY